MRRKVNRWLEREANAESFLVMVLLSLCFFIILASQGRSNDNPRRCYYSVSLSPPIYISSNTKDMSQRNTNTLIVQ